MKPSDDLLKLLGLEEEDKKEPIMSVGQAGSTDTMISPTREPAIEEVDSELEEMRKAQGEYEDLQRANKEAKSPNLETKEEKFDANKEYIDLIKRYKKDLETPDKEADWREHLPDILAGLHNIVSYGQGRSERMPMGHSQAAKAARQKEKDRKLAKQEKLAGLLKQLSTKATPKVYQTKSGLVQLDKEGKPVEIYKDPLAALYGETRKQDVGLRGEKFEEKKLQKSQDDAAKAIESLRKTDTWKDSEKALSNIPTIEALLDDAYEKGGQSLAMLGPRVAKGVAGEVGVLTEQDVTRYVKNPSLAGGLMDTLKKIKSGQITEASYENLKRLLSISKQTAQEKMNEAIDREAILLSRREKMPFEQAVYLLDSAYRRRPEEKRAESKEAKKEQAGPYGEIVERGGKTYKWNPLVNKYQLYKGK